MKFLILFFASILLFVTTMFSQQGKTVLISESLFNYNSHVVTEQGRDIFSEILKNSIRSGDYIELKGVFFYNKNLSVRSHEKRCNELRSVLVEMGYSQDRLSVDCTCELVDDSYGVLPYYFIVTIKGRD